MDFFTLLALGGVGAVAGYVDAVAGGGGLIGVPALLGFGVPPVAALATNKLQSSVGTAVAAFTYWRQGLVSIRSLFPAIVLTFLGSMLGATVVRSIDVSLLNSAVPIALIVIAGYFMFAPNLSDADRHARLRLTLFAPLIGFVIGFYDGIFGPGTGSFFTMAFVLLFGLGVTRASAHTKVLNETSNLAALVIFIPAGEVIWSAAIAMAVGQVVGGRFGALSGIRWGAKLIRPVVVVISVLLAVWLLVFR